VRNIMTDALNWYGEDVATFGDRLEAARRNANLSQRELAKHIGIKNSTLRNWEDDVTEPRANKLNTLAGMLNVSLMWLINGEGDGLEGSDENSVSDANLDAALIEIRELRVQMMHSANRLAKLEKRLRNKS
jgi:transcriptional regulator with XRE-family HTH domain